MPSTRSAASDPLADGLRQRDTPMRLVALVDSSAFYCSCERLFVPALRGRPVVVLSNNDGCVISRTAEAKALGVAMGAPYFKVRRQLERDGVAVFSSNYTLYADLSRRVMAVLERFAPDVEVHSIDEAFLTLPATRGPDGAPAPGERERLEALAAEVRQTVLSVTGIPVRVSIAETKTLAKAASEYARGHGGAVCFWGHPDAAGFLDALPVREVWGIGPRWGARLEAVGTTTARQFMDLDDATLRRHYTVVGLRTAWELRGVPCITDGGPVTRRTLVRSRSFGTRTDDLPTVLEAVATHAARAAEKLRAEGLRAGALQAFVSTGRHGDGPHRHGALGSSFAPADREHVRDRPHGPPAGHGLLALGRRGRPPVPLPQGRRGLDRPRPARGLPGRPVRAPDGRAPRAAGGRGPGEPAVRAAHRRRRGPRPTERARPDGRRARRAGVGHAPRADEPTLHDVLERPPSRRVAPRTRRARGHPTAAHSQVTAAEGGQVGPAGFEPATVRL